VTQTRVCSAIPCQATGNTGDNHQGYHGPRWTQEQVALLGILPDYVVSEQIGGTVNAVRILRQRKGIPNPAARPGAYNRQAVQHDVLERFEVSFQSEQEFERLIAFLRDLCRSLDEQAIYLTRGDESFLVHRQE